MTRGEPPSTESNWSHLAGLRALREADAVRVVDLYREAYGDDRPIDTQMVMSWLQNDPAIGSRRCVLERGDAIVGFATLSITNEEMDLEVAAPHEWPTFLKWAENTARLNRVVRVRTVSYAGSELPTAAANRGYHISESSYTMEIVLTEVVPAVTPLPTGIRVTAYRDEDAEPLRVALSEIFADDPSFDEPTLQQFKRQYVGVDGMDPSLWSLAWHDHELAAFVLAYPRYFRDPAVGFIHSLGVRSGWRRRGMGEALTRRTFRTFHERDLRVVRLGVDASNETAVSLYHRLGMRAIRQADEWTLDLDQGTAAPRQPLATAH